MNFMKGEFQLKSTSNSNPKHLVQFSTPSCICESWNKSQYPCKHFTVFAACQEWGFSTLPEEYRNTVFITLDTENLDVDEPTREIRRTVHNRTAFAVAGEMVIPKLVKKST